MLFQWLYNFRIMCVLNGGTVCTENVGMAAQEWMTAQSSEPRPVALHSSV